MKNKTLRLVTSGIMIALAVVLSFIKVYKLPLGGSITLLSMLPICILSIKYGTKWGLFSAFVYSLIQIGLDLGEIMTWGLTLKLWIGCLVFDYLIAYTALGLAGAFRKSGSAGYIGGIVLALCVRFVSHVISGSIFFDIWCPDDWSVFPYSLAYNGSYMGPELIFTVIAAIILLSIPQTKKLIKPETL